MFLLESSFQDISIYDTDCTETEEHEYVGIHEFTNRYFLFQEFTIDISAIDKGSYKGIMQSVSNVLTPNLTIYEIVASKGILMVDMEFIYPTFHLQSNRRRNQRSSRD